LGRPPGRGAQAACHHLLVLVDPVLLAVGLADHARAHVLVLRWQAIRPHVRGLDDVIVDGHDPVQVVGRALAGALAHGSFPSSSHDVVRPSMVMQRGPRALACERPQARLPPSTLRTWPLTWAASSEARKANTAATSSGRPRRPKGMIVLMSSGSDPSSG